MRLGTCHHVITMEHCLEANHHGHNPHAEIWLIDGQSNAFYPVSVTGLLHVHYLKN